MIDDLLRERSQWMGARHVGPPVVAEVTIPINLGTIVDTRSARKEAWIDEAGSKRPHVEGGSSSVCRSVRDGARPDTV